jgi:hypothetical protein
MVDSGRRRRTSRWFGCAGLVVIAAAGCSAPERDEPVVSAPGAPGSTSGGSAPVSTSDGAMACEALVMVATAALEPLVETDGGATTELDAMRAEWWRWAPPQFRDHVVAIEAAVADHLAALTELYEAAARNGRRPDEHAVSAELARGERAVREAAMDSSRWIDDHCFGHAP